ncbi:hypothetical protein BDD18_4216 [Acidovorax temperans]|uniref:Uncharacterized protein n=1 Tax=Acidovorax temperans TaxID=80878 RepID=A0A543KTG2_9BURK|nr:hypothetical protein BDD18_4216 [Acidovorax temperans]
MEFQPVETHSKQEHFLEEEMKASLTSINKQHIP